MSEIMNEMTNEEARAIMTALKQSYINLRTKSDLKKKTVKDNIKAYDMAIKALETIPKYKDAYNKGWDDGAKATNVDCGVVWEERIDAIKTDIDKQTEIHSDGEFYIKNIDVKRIIDKHCGGENE